MLRWACPPNPYVIHHVVANIAQWLRRGQFKAAASHDIGDHYSSKGRAVVLGDMTGHGLRQCGGGNLRLVEPVFQSFKFVVPITGDELDCSGNRIEVIGQECA